MNVLNQLSPEKSTSSYQQSKQNSIDSSSAVGLESRFKKILGANISSLSDETKALTSTLFSAFDKKEEFNKALSFANDGRDSSLNLNDDFERLEKSKIDEAIKDKHRDGNKAEADKLEGNDREKTTAMDKPSKLEQQAGNDETIHRQLSKLFHSVENAIEALQKLKNNEKGQQPTNSPDLLKTLLNLRLQLKGLQQANQSVLVSGGDKLPTDVAMKLHLQINNSIKALKESISQGNTQTFSNSAEKIFNEFLENASILQKKTAILSNTKLKSSLNLTANGKVFLPGVEVDVKALSTVDEKTATNPRNLITRDATAVSSPTQSSSHTFLLAQHSSVAAQGKLQLKAAQHQVRVTGSFIGKNFLKGTEVSTVKGVNLPQFGDGLSGNLGMSKQSAATSFDGLFSQFGFASNKLAMAKNGIATGSSMLAENANNLLYGRATKKSSTADAKLARLVANRMPAMLVGNNATTALAGSEITSAGPAVRAEEIIDKITGQVKMAYAGGRETINVKLQPAHLGNVNLWIKKQNGKISLRLRVESEEVKTIIEKGIASIAKGLSGVNIEMDSLTVEVQPRFTTTSEAMGTIGKKKPSSDGNKNISFNETNRVEKRNLRNELNELSGLEKATFDANKVVGSDANIETKVDNLEDDLLDEKQLENETLSRLSIDNRFVAHSTHIKFAGASQLNKFFA